MLIVRHWCRTALVAACASGAGCGSVVSSNSDAAPPDASGCPAPDFTGSLLVSRQSDIAEYDLAGNLVRTIEVEGGTDADPTLRDLAIDECGGAVVYRGTADPSVGVLDPATGTWTHFDDPGFSTADQASYGGLAYRAPFIFATDMTTVGGPARGVLRIDTRDRATRRFAIQLNPIDVALGLDDKIYVLDADEQTVAVFSPDPPAEERTIALAGPVRAVAVTAAGEIYGVGRTGQVFHFAADGAQVASQFFDIGGLTDVDVATDGLLAIGTDGGAVGLMNTELGIEGAFTTVSGNRTFVTFTPAHGAATP